MNEQDLFNAIGSVEDGLLPEIEQPHIRRLPKRFGLIAATFALLLTACAAPVVIHSFDKLQDGKPAENGRVIERIIYPVGGTGGDTLHFLIPTDVELDVTVEAEAPDSIEEHLIPLKLLDYCDVESYTDSESEFTLELSMNVPRYGRAYGAFYRQIVLPEDGNIVVQDIFGSEPHEKEKALQTYGDVTALEFTGRAWYDDADGGPLLYDGSKVAAINTKYIFWSDGFYLYCLKLPIAYPLTTDKVEEVVTSLTAVEDITEYLPAQ